MRDDGGGVGAGRATHEQATASCVVGMVVVVGMWVMTVILLLIVAVTEDTGGYGDSGAGESNVSDEMVG
jgi:hypothetical protein